MNSQSVLVDTMLCAIIAMELITMGLYNMRRNYEAREIVVLGLEFLAAF